MVFVKLMLVMVVCGWLVVDVASIGIIDGETTVEESTIEMGQGPTTTVGVLMEEGETKSTELAEGLEMNEAQVEQEQQDILEEQEVEKEHNTRATQDVFEDVQIEELANEEPSEEPTEEPTQEPTVESTQEPTQEPISSSHASSVSTPAVLMRMNTFLAVVDTWFNSSFVLALESLDEASWSLLGFIAVLSGVVASLIVVLVLKLVSGQRPTISSNPLKRIKKGESLEWLNSFFKVSQPDFSKDKFKDSFLRTFNATLVRITGPSSEPLQVANVDVKEMNLPKLSFMKFHFRHISLKDMEGGEKKKKKRQRDRTLSTVTVDQHELSALHKLENTSLIKMAFSCVIEYDDVDTSGIYLDVTTSATGATMRVKLALLTAKAYLVMSNTGRLYSLSFRKVLESKFSACGEANEIVPAHIHSQLKHALEQAFMEPQALKWQTNKSIQDLHTETISTNQLNPIRLTVKKISDVMTSTTGPYRYVFSIFVDEPKQSRKTAAVVSPLTTVDIFKFVYIQIRKSSLIRIQLHDETSRVVLGSEEVTGEELLSYNDRDIHIVIKGMLGTSKATKGEVTLSWVPTGVAEPEVPFDEDFFPEPQEDTVPDNTQLNLTLPESPISMVNGSSTPISLRNGPTLSQAALRQLNAFNNDTGSMQDHETLSLHSNLTTMSTWDRAGVQPLILRMKGSSLSVIKPGSSIRGGKKIYAIHGHAFEKSKVKKDELCFVTNEKLKTSMIGTSAYRCLFCHRCVKKEHVGLIVAPCRKSCLPRNILNMEEIHRQEQMQSLSEPTKQMLLDFEQQQLQRPTTIRRSETMHGNGVTRASYNSLEREGTLRATPFLPSISSMKISTMNHGHPQGRTSSIQRIDADNRSDNRSDTNTMRTAMASTRMSRRSGSKKGGAQFV
eukprot:m.38317 g.38317  ORF g.38317 m.38317 type:complete len:896 (-) comp6790_c0_seq2:176-2863(-)